MPATLLTFSQADSVTGKLLLVPIGESGPTLAHVQDWLIAQLKAKQKHQAVGCV